MEKQIKLNKSILTVALITVTILMVPLVAMQFSNEVDWSVADFIVMGALIFGTGLSFVLVMRYATNMVYKLALTMAFGTTFLMVWANLAVGLIGSGPHLGNLMYLGVIALVVIGSLRSRFTSIGMERAMYATAVALVLVALIQLFTGVASDAGSSVNEIIAVNGFFATLFAVSGSLFRFASPEKSTEKSEV